ncbi:MAG TPA: hypothetical protein VJ793_18285 [Anaerolineae bacterium]|nr:hypothetical protein [Anaerolineae bacterium]
MSSRKKGQRRPRKQKRFASLKRRLEEGPFPVKRIVVEPSGQVKMSDVLADFVEPYSHLADTEEAYRKLLTLAVLAWNASFLPKNKQQEMIDQVIDGGIPTGTEELRAGLKDIVRMLIARKQKHFAEYKRNMIDFELTDTGTGYRLTVASTLDEVAS